MKRLIFFLILFLSAFATFSQSKYYIRGDSVYIEKVGGNGELILLNAGRDAQKGGVLYNIGGGRTAFKKTAAINDSTFIVGGDTIVIKGGVKGGSNTNIATAPLTATGDYNHDWTQHWFFLNNLKAIELKSDRPDPHYPGNNKVFRFYSDSTAAATALQIAWGLKDINNSGTDSVHGELSSSTVATSILHWGHGGARFAELDIRGNVIDPDITLLAASETKVSLITLGSTTYINPNDSLRIKAVPATTATKMLAIRSMTGNVGTVVAMDIPAGVPTDSAIFATKFGVDTAKANIRNQINGKQPTGNYITGLNGDGAATGPALANFVLSPTSVTPGTYKLLTATVDQKGRTTFAANGIVEQINDSTFRINSDTITIHGTSGGSSADSTIFSTIYGRDTAIANVRSQINGKQPTGNYITALTGPVTASGPGSVATSITNNAITDAMLRQSAGLSVIGTSANSTGNVADITASTDGHMLRRNGTSIGFGSLDLANSNAVGSSILPIANGGTGTATPSLVSGTNVSITGTWPNQTINSSGGGGQILVNDLGRLPVIKQHFPAQGIQASGTTVINYPISALDSTLYYFTTVNNFASGTKYGGVLWATPIGDSMLVSAPFGVVFGSSFMEGHRLLHGRLHAPGGPFIWNWPDSAGQPSYHLRQLTNMRWYNQAVGGWGSDETRLVFARDVLAQTLTTDPGDGRGVKTLSKKPLYAIYDGIGNDPYKGITPERSIRNLKYFAQSCFDNKIKLIVFNSPTGFQGTTTSIQHHSIVNKFLEEGGLDAWGVTVFDMKSFWSDPAYGYDGVHGNPLIVDPFDGIHLTKAGYDSLSRAVFNICKLPKVTKISFINKLDPIDPITNYAYVDSLSISSVGYKLTKQSDTLDIISPLVTDSIWFKAKHITGVAGAGTNYGYEHINFLLDNNISNDSLYTRRTQYSNGANSQYVTAASVDIIPETYNSNKFVFGVGGATLDVNDHALTVHPAGAGGYVILNGASSTSRISSAILSIYGGTGIGMDGNIKATGTNHQFGNFQLTYNEPPSDVGWGLSLNYTGINSRYAFSTVAGTSYDQFTFREYSGALTALNDARETNIINVNNIGFSAPLNTLSTGNVFNVTPTYNITGTETQGTAINFMRYKPTLTSLTGTRHKALLLFSGNNYLNASSDSTCIGCDSASNILAKFRVNGSVRLDGLAAPSSYNLMVHSKGADSLVGQVPLSVLDTRPSLKITGETTAGDGNPAGITMYGRTATVPASKYSYGVQDFSFVTASSGFRGYLGFQSWPYVTGDAPGSLFNKFGGYVNSFSSAPLWDGSLNGTHQLPVLLSYFSALQTQAGGVQDAYDNYASEINSVGGTTMNPAVVNHYALYAEPFTYATNNYGIYINGTQKNYFGGQVQVDGSLLAKAGQYNKVNAITSNTTIDLTYNVITVDATSGNVTITLPAASTAFGSNMGIVYKFQRLDNSGNTVTIQRAGSDTINGGTSFTLTTQYEKKELQCVSSSAWAQW